MTMMKRALVLTALLIAMPMSAAKADNDVGCGVGTMIWEGNSGVGFKLMASFTNSFAFQSISVTFGLLNCDGQGMVTANAGSRHFASTNLDRIARDSAVGGGESLDALAALYRVDTADRAIFAALAQDHFDELFSSDHVTSDEVIETLERLMREDERLSIYARS
jgi:hypothetical protein